MIDTYCTPDVSDDPQLGGVSFFDALMDEHEASLDLSVTNTPVQIRSKVDGSEQ